MVVRTLLAHRPLLAGEATIDHVTDDTFPQKHLDLHPFQDPGYLPIACQENSPDAIQDDDDGLFNSLYHGPHEQRLRVYLW